jgi:hypothetical protein
VKCIIYPFWYHIFFLGCFHKSQYLKKEKIKFYDYVYIHHGQKEGETYFTDKLIHANVAMIMILIEQVVCMPPHKAKAGAS